MPVVMKENKQLTVLEEKVEEFLELGYVLLDKKGKIIKRGNATSLEDIKSENDTLKTKYSELEAKCKALEAELEELKAAKKTK